MAHFVQPLIRLPHLRHPWAGSEIVHVCGRWGRLKGTDESARFKEASRQDYQSAKFNGDFSAAARLVEDCLKRNPTVIDEIIDVLAPFMSSGRQILCAVPHPSFDDDDGGEIGIANQETPRNVIPSAYASYLAEIIGAEVDDDIVERERIGRTKLAKFERFLWQPSFTGAVRRDVVYVLVDDVFTLGGTMAAFRSYVVGNGGTVVLLTALAHQSGKYQPLALTKKTWDELKTRFGVGLDQFWKDEVGHGADCLTEAEGKVLIDWARSEIGTSSGVPILQRLRNCLAETAAKSQQPARAHSG